MLYSRPTIQAKPSLPLLFSQGAIIAIPPPPPSQGAIIAIIFVFQRSHHCYYFPKEKDKTFTIDSFIYVHFINCTFIAQCTPSLRLE